MTEGPPEANNVDSVLNSGNVKLLGTGRYPILHMHMSRLFESHHTANLCASNASQGEPGANTAEAARLTFSAERDTHDRNFTLSCQARETGREAAPAMCMSTIWFF